MIRRHVSSLLAGLFVLSLLAPLAQAQGAEQAIRTMMEARDRDIKKAIKPLVENPDGATEAQRQQAASLINDQIDFEEMGRQALGTHWTGLSDEQRTAFVGVFGDIVRSQSLTDLDAYNASVTYDKISVDGEKAYVKTTTTYQDKKIAVDYVLGKKDATWWVYDIVLDEVGTVEGYARSFQTVIRKRGFDGLMKSLYKKRDKMQASS